MEDCDSNFEAKQRRGVHSEKYWKYDMSRLKMVCDYKVEHGEPLSTVAMSVDNLWVFSSSHDSKLRMYSMEEMQLMRSVPLGNQEDINISCCAPMPNNKTVLVGSWKNSICAYSIEYARTYQYNQWVQGFFYNLSPSSEPTPFLFALKTFTVYKIRLEKNPKLISRS